MSVPDTRMLMTIYGAGLVSSIGPCAMPRMLAILSHNTRGISGVSAYLVGIVVSVLGLGLSVRAFEQAITIDRSLQLLLAVVLVLGGLWTLFSTQACTESTVPPRGIFAALSLGVSMGCIVSPCCAPVLVWVFGIISSLSIGSTIAVLCVFSFGQISTIAVLGILPRWLKKYMRISPIFQEASHILAATLSLFLGGYYALLAL